MDTMAAVEPYRFTVEEYERMGQVGILGEDDRVELIDGQIVQMTPIGVPHAGTVGALSIMFTRAIGDRAIVWAQNPIELGEFSEPQPDLMLLRPPLATYRRRHPLPKDVHLLVEVADTSGPLDRGVKLSLYAQAGVPEYWIVDLEKNVVEVHRSPSGDRYASVERLAPGNHVSPKAFPDVELEVSEILGR